MTREVAVDAVDVCVAFYALLGFRPVAEPASLAGRARWLEATSADGQGRVIGRTQIHLMPKGDTPAVAGHIGIVCRDFAGTVAALQAAGHAVEARQQHWGAPRAYVRDPAGHLVEIMGWAPGEEARGEPDAAADPRMRP